MSANCRSDSFTQCQSLGLELCRLGWDSTGKHIACALDHLTLGAEDVLHSFADFWSGFEEGTLAGEKVEEDLVRADELLHKLVIMVAYNKAISGISSML